MLSLQGTSGTIGVVPIRRGWVKCAKHGFPERLYRTMKLQPKIWVPLGLALGHAAIIAALALTPHREPQKRSASLTPSILECREPESPKPLR